MDYDGRDEQMQFQHIAVRFLDAKIEKKNEIFSMNLTSNPTFSLLHSSVTVSFTFDVA